MLQKIKKIISRLVMGSYLPCYVYSHKPLIVFAYDYDFIKDAPDFIAQFKKHDEVYLFLQLGWQCQQNDVSRLFSGHIHEIQKQCPQLKITILTNTPEEVTVLSNLGLNAVYCHQNAFIDESKYNIIEGVPKVYDAIYIARISPFKRHALAREIRSLRLIGDYHLREQEYVDGILKMLSHAVRSQKVLASDIPKELAKCRCGLCLSKEEGAMFVSAEYLLCGLPIVNTENIGGRDYLFPDFAVKTVPDNSHDIADAVRYFCANPIDPHKIREATLEKMQVHRATLTKLIQEILPNQENITFPHKLGLRCTRMPWVNWTHGLPR